MGKKVKWLVGVLVVSLLVNVFVFGSMLGNELHKKERRHQSPPIDFNLKKFGKFLSKEDHKKVRSLVKAQRKDLGVSYRSLRKTEKTIVELISAEVVDREALEKALKDRGEQVQKLHTPLQNVFLEMVTELDYDTRKKLADDLFRDHRRKSMHKDKKK